VRSFESFLSTHRRQLSLAAGGRSTLSENAPAR